MSDEETNGIYTKMRLLEHRADSLKIDADDKKKLINELYNKVNNLERKADMANQRLVEHQEWKKDHEQLHKDLEKERRTRNWQMIVMIVGIVSTLLATIIKGVM